MLAEEFPFECEVPTGGYEWVWREEVAIGHHLYPAGHYLTEKGGRPLSRRARVGFMRSRPDETDPALYLSFAALPPGDRGAALAFADRFGRLHNVIAEGESFAVWAAEAAELRHATQVHELLGGDRAALGDVVRWGKLVGRPAVVEEDWYVRAPGPEYGLPWGDGSDGWWSPVLGRLAPTSDPRAVAGQWLDSHINGKLMNESAARVAADPESGRRQFVLEPLSLLGLLWLQFARTVVKDKKHGRCKECGKPFEVVPGRKERQVFCGTPCKLKDYRKRKARAAELAAAGTAPKAIAAELGTDVPTVRGWIKAAKGKGGTR